MTICFNLKTNAKNCKSWAAISLCFYVHFFKCVFKQDQSSNSKETVPNRQFLYALKLIHTSKDTLTLFIAQLFLLHKLHHLL